MEGKTLQTFGCRESTSKFALNKISDSGALFARLYVNGEIQSSQMSADRLEIGEVFRRAVKELVCNTSMLDIAIDNKFRGCTLACGLL